jgi:hypothetical protein
LATLLGQRPTADRRAEGTRAVRIARTPVSFRTVLPLGTAGQETRLDRCTWATAGAIHPPTARSSAAIQAASASAAAGTDAAETTAISAAARCTCSASCAPARAPARPDPETDGKPSACQSLTSHASEERGSTRLKRGHESGEKQSACRRSKQLGREMERPVCQHVPPG